VSGGCRAQGVWAEAPNGSARWEPYTYTYYTCLYWLYSLYALCFNDAGVFAAPSSRCSGLQPDCRGARGKRYHCSARWEPYIYTYYTCLYWLYSLYALCFNDAGVFAAPSSRCSGLQPGCLQVGARGKRYHCSARWEPYIYTYYTYLY